MPSSPHQKLPHSFKLILHIPIIQPILMLKHLPMSPANQHIVIVAGEESGDIHAADLIKKLLQHHSKLSISGIGGKHMQAAGANLIYDLASYGVTGLTE